MSSLRLLLLPTALVMALNWAAEPTPSPPHEQSPGNRLVYLDETDPYYVSRTFPKLITPQWVGESGVEAVIILSIDDLRDPVKYEAFLRPILERLKEIDGRAPLSIMCNRTDPQNALFQKWLKEGVSLETHTLTHPFPMLNSNSLAKSKRDYDGEIDLLHEIPGAAPVAFRTPNCDGRNTLSPRFFTEIFNQKTEQGRFLTIDSSVFNFPTANDPDLPKEIAKDAEGQDRFLKFIPTDVFANSIFDYPYPYVISRLCWEFPCAAPSDYEASTKNGSASPKTIDYMKSGIDAAVAKRGTFTLCFHPHGWIKNSQIVELIDHAVATHGKKVKFLTFKEAQERIDKNLLNGQPLRNAKGQDNGVRLIDLDNDGYLDVVIGNEKLRQTRLWQPKTNSWRELPFPRYIVNGGETGQRFGILRADKKASFLIQGPEGGGESWDFDGEKWQKGIANKDGTIPGLSFKNGSPVATMIDKIDNGVRLRDIDGDGVCELIVSNTAENAIFKWSEADKAWSELPFALPANTSIVDADGNDNGLRFMDINGDGFPDVIFSNESRFSLHLFTSMKDGWSKEITTGVRGGTGATIPMIARAGSNNGVWFQSGQMNIQNENVAFDRVAFADLGMGVQHSKAPHPPAQPSLDSSKALKVHPGFTGELVVSEPVVQDPIAFDWGPDGKFWVVEMGDYPLGVLDKDGKYQASGRVILLESTKGDGKYDKSSIFLDNLPYPTGVTAWKKGVLVFCPPDLFYAEDTKGDGHADKREVLFTGFKEGNPQHRANGLVRGLDNWLYGANGDSNGKITSLKTGKIVDISGRDFRLHPDDGAFETVTGRTQFGRVRDDWGNWFGSMNSAPLYHYPIEERYLRRNAFAVLKSISVNFGDHPLFPISSGVPGFNFTRRFTSACSPAVYRDDLFGPAFESSIFEAEPAHNLIHREVLSVQGSTFTSERAADEPDFDFAASSDPWFRPATIKIGPDGALWIADMYRYVIEHPQWIPASVQAHVDLRAGSDLGRIYRVYPTKTPPRAIPRLDTLDGPALAAALDSPSGWQRDMVQELIVQRQQKELVPLLEKLAASSARPQCRLQALCVLDGLSALTPPVLLAALKDAHPGVRTQALRLSETLLKANAQLQAAVLDFPDDADGLVQLQLACTLGECDDPRAGERLSRLVLQHASDPFFSAAVLSSLNKTNFTPTLLAVANAKGSNAPALLGKLVSIAPHFADGKTFATLLGKITALDGGKAAGWQLDALGAFLDSLDSSNASLAKILETESAESTAAKKGLADFFAAARAIASDPAREPAERLPAIKLMGRGLDKREDDIVLLSGLLTPRFDTDTQSAAVTALVALNDPKIGDVLLKGWRGYGSALRTLVVQVLFRRETWINSVLTLLEQKKIQPFEIEASQRQRLLWHTTLSIKERAIKIFEGAIESDRQKIVDAFKPALALEGVLKGGEKVFSEKCVTCHRLGTLGTPVGPNLDALADNSPEALAIAILDPNRAVEPRYINYQLATLDGQRFTGMLDADAPASVTLLEPGGRRQTIPRDQIKSLASTGISTMPEGLEVGMTAQDLANLIAFVRSFKPSAPRRIFAGNVPETIKPVADGTLLLPASACEIFGKSLAYETEHSNLGYWNESDDYAAWTVDVPAAGKYTVWLDWACLNSSAGNAFVVRSSGNALNGKVEGTGGWETYKQANIGEIALTAGKQKIIFKASGKIERFLLDLRSLKLVPLRNP